MDINEAKKILADNGYLVEVGLFDKLADKIHGKPQIVTPKLELQFTDENTKKWYMALLDFFRNKGIKVIKTEDGGNILRNQYGYGCGRLIIDEDEVGLIFPKDSTDYTAGSLKITSKKEPDIQKAMAYLEQKLDY